MHKELLLGKKILLGITGSIAIYKALELIRLFIKSGAEVKVVMSEDAKKFIAPLTFETLSQNKVLHGETESWSEGLSHIHTGKWADLFLIAPASVNTINKLSHGIADNLLTQTAIAFTKTLMLAPSANTNMMLNPITQESLSKLAHYGYEIIQPQSKLLACNDEGVGALADVEEIFYRSAKALLKEPFWQGRNVIITGGGTREKIDDVRCLSNFSSGKQASALALCLYLKGANVTLISSGETPLLQEINLLHVKSSFELHHALTHQMEQQKRSEKMPYLFMAAAVSDYVPLHSHSGKLKKETLGEIFILELKRNLDILSTIPKKGYKVIGFKAELDEKNGLINAQKMLEAKELDAVCLNILKEQNNFGSNKNEITFITKTHVETLPLSDKFHIAQAIVEQSQNI
ncbi:bifunctional phosphopantothenoylcysteine decarboxylase/phosphopantothenate--cysteine ligase CoaBC [Sulfurospirillum deleyianum]|uniref:Coenzyme A biosynthesis bifunctional protein CoaBC n=1 Tax=Sulfurospirillum deleyianum (strain ATCC 51133 / DSM 6946 / 5175) TaxID=525898 RepID=D1B227_SULD5|nr:bifunctional phosphopantothenoylcysteine decarboxylase/phosphopantothenate--cysteine ligase CoaBC [Sulfurospirillum deleyianum]ACZ12147.1 phosphopantothenoylcysteine decarboxylase/phosphopantothenate/cysteine ligase [Sulfurospirillum deleyianum DSM 6946]